MVRTAGVLLSAAMAVILIGACDEAAGGRDSAGTAPGGGKADDADSDGESNDEAQLAFIEAVGRCESLADRGRRTIGEARIEQRLEVEVERLDCLREANDETLGAIEATLQDVESPLTGNAEEAFTAWREANAEFCELLVSASAFALEKDAEVHESGCLGDAEVLLSEAIVAYVALGGTPAEPPDAREAYETCYETFDAAIEAEPEETMPMEEAELEVAIDAHAELGECIRLETKALDDEIAANVAESFPGRGEDYLEEEIHDDFEGTEDAAVSVCNVLGSASLAAGEPEAELTAESCAVSSEIWRRELIGTVVPELAPADSEGP